MLKTRRRKKPISCLIKRYFSVESSHISKIGYNHEEGTLAIIFKGGAEYHYNIVDAHLWGKMCGADSVGSFFGENIKNSSEITSKKIRV